MRSLNTGATDVMKVVRSIVASVTVVAVMLTLLVSAGPSGSASAQGECPDGSVLSANGVTCELDVGQNDEPDPNDPNNVCPDGETLNAAGIACEPVFVEETPCPEGQQLDLAGLRCEAIPSDNPCPAGQEVDELGIMCVAIPVDEDEAPACDEGYSLGADGVSCIADGPRCEADEILSDAGDCQKSFQCSPGFVLGSDLLTCLSDGCPEDQLLSVDGKRCLAPDVRCPDGSPRPVGGACLVVETIQGEDGTEIVVRCAAEDAFCQASVKACADAKAAGDSDDEQSCEDPRARCDDGDDACEQANDRLVDCATRDDSAAPEDGGVQRIDPCEDLCPRLHRLDDSGECVEFLDPTHPCVSFGRIPSGVTTNAQLDAYSYLAGTGQCVTRVEFLRRLANFEAAAGAEQDALALLRETTSQYLTVEEQLAELDSQLLIAERQVREFTAAAALADGKRVQNAKALAETRKELVRERELLRAEAVEVFVMGGPDVVLDAATLSAANATELGALQTYGRALLDDQVDNIDRVSALEDDTVALGAELDQAAEEVAQSLDGAKATTVAVETLLEEARVLRVEQLERRDQEAELVSELRADKALYAQELGIFEQASREIADIISESEFLVTEFENFDGLFANPVIPAVVGSPFGPRLHPILGYVRNHNGLDFGASFGDPIYASAPGIVQIASERGGYGNTVVLDHGGGLLTLYAHMSVIGAEAGDEIQRGDIIGFIGSTGLSTGPHLHFEVWVEGRTAVDPFPYLTDLN